MLYIAFKMLIGDRVKFLGLVLGVAFSTLLIAQQASIFVGVLDLSAAIVRGNPMVDVWVMRDGVRTVSQPEQMPETWLNRVRGVEGVLWGMPLYRGAATVRTRSGELRMVEVMGVDDATLIGAPEIMLLGPRDAMQRPDSVVLDIATFSNLLPGEPVQLGDVLEINKQRVTVSGICKAAKSITGGDVMYAKRSLALRLAQEANNTVSFVLVKAKPGVQPRELAARISAVSGLAAFDSAAFERRVIGWTIDNTGIVQVLGSVIALGIVVGVLVVGQTFYMFGVENQRYFAALKALGTTNGRLVMMVGFQASLVAFLGYGLGIGATTLILIAGDTNTSPMRGMTLSGPVFVATAVFIPAMVLVTAWFGTRKVLYGEPAIVFRA